MRPSFSSKRRMSFEAATVLGNLIMEHAQALAVPQSFLKSVEPRGWTCASGSTRTLRHSCAQELQARPLRQHQAHPRAQFDFRAKLELSELNDRLEIWQITSQGLSRNCRPCILKHSVTEKQPSPSPSPAQNVNMKQSRKSRAT